MDMLNGTSVNVLYLVLLGIGLAYAVFLLITGQLGAGDVDVGDLDVHVDVGADIQTPSGEHPHGISPISPLTIATFITAFGATGIVSTTLFSASEKISLVWATVGGVVFSILIYVGFTYLFIKPQGSSEVHLAELTGKNAEVITPIPSGGMGEIALVAQGGRVVYSARTKDGTPVDRGNPVRIIRITGGIAYIELIKD